MRSLMWDIAPPIYLYVALVLLVAMSGVGAFFAQSIWSVAGNAVVFGMAATILFLFRGGIPD